MVPPRTPSFCACRSKAQRAFRPDKPAFGGRAFRFGAGRDRSRHPLVAQHGRGARLRPGRFVVRIHAGGLTMRRRSNGRTPGCYPVHAGSTQPSQLAPPAAPGSRPADLGLRREREKSSFLGRLTAGSSALNRRMRGSNPARGASHGRGHGVHPASNAEGEGSIPSVRAFAPVVQSARMPVSQTGDAGSNPARGTPRDRSVSR